MSISQIDSLIITFEALGIDGAVAAATVVVDIRQLEMRWEELSMPEITIGFGRAKAASL